MEYLMYLVYFDLLVPPILGFITMVGLYIRHWFWPSWDDKPWVGVVVFAVSCIPVVNLYALYIILYCTLSEFPYWISSVYNGCKNFIQTVKNKQTNKTIAEYEETITRLRNDKFELMGEIYKLFIYTQGMETTLNNIANLSGEEVIREMAIKAIPKEKHDEI